MYDKSEPERSSRLRLLDALIPWCMVPVFLMGVLVAVVKMVGLASLVPGIGLFATAVLAVFITMLTGLSSHKLLSMAHDMGLDAPVEKSPRAPTPALFARAGVLSPQFAVATPKVIIEINERIRCTRFIVLQRHRPCDGSDSSRYSTTPAKRVT